MQLGTQPDLHATRKFFDDVHKGEAEDEGFLKMVAYLEKASNSNNNADMEDCGIRDEDLLMWD